MDPEVGPEVGSEEGPRWVSRWAPMRAKMDPEVGLNVPQIWTLLGSVRPRG